MLLRLLIYFLLAGLFFLVLKVYFTGRKSLSRDRRRKTETEIEEMVLDPQCQSYLPKKDAIQQGGYFFCSRECATLFLSR